VAVIDFQAKKEARGAHLSGECRCMECHHEWVAVRPRGESPEWLECPACGLTKGRPQGPYWKEGADTWRCNCGNDLFQITPAGAYCPHCGEWFSPEGAVAQLIEKTGQALARFEAELHQITGEPGAEPKYAE
jgi:hypothetical protein